MHDISNYAAFAVYNQIILETIAPKSICSKLCLQRANRHPVTNIPLPLSTVHPLLLYSKKIKLYSACHLCNVREKWNH